jgi:hypothetical protein
MEWMGGMECMDSLLSLFGPASKWLVGVTRSTLACGVGELSEAPNVGPLYRLTTLGMSQTRTV